MPLLVCKKLGSLHCLVCAVKFCTLAGGPSTRAAIIGIGAGFGAGSAYADSQKEVAAGDFELRGWYKLLSDGLSNVCAQLEDVLRKPTQT